MENSFTNISERDKQIIKSVAPFLIAIVLFIIVGKFGISQISNIRSKIKTAEKKHSTLSQKLNILRSISQVSSDWADLTVYALPESNPSLQLLSQLRLISSNNSVILSEMRISSGAPRSENLSTINSSFTVLGTKDSVIAFCNDLGKIAPITIISRIELSDQGGITQADVTTATFYAGLPKSIPSVTQQIIDLSDSEKELISQIEDLQTPIIGQSFSPSTEGLNSAPFGE